jgi:hypothetical protein
MEYAIPINANYDDNYTKFVGYQQDNKCIQEYFSQQTVSMISKKVTELLMGVDPRNRPIIVPDRIIANVMDSIYTNFRPATGDIFGRYNVPSGSSTDSYVQSMIDQTIEVIVSDVRNNLEQEESNKKLTVYTTILGSFNEHGLRSHSKIKTRNRRPTPMLFNMNY